MGIMFACTPTFTYSLVCNDKVYHYGNMLRIVLCIMLDTVHDLKMEFTWS